VLRYTSRTGKFGTLSGTPPYSVAYHATGMDVLFHWAGNGVMQDRRSSRAGGHGQGMPHGHLWLSLERVMNKTRT
jgi:hypothetical protein